MVIHKYGENMLEINDNRKRWLSSYRKILPKFRHSKINKIVTVKTHYLVFGIMMILTTACTMVSERHSFDKKKISDFRLINFQADKTGLCQATDVNLTQQQSSDFFQMAKPIDSKTIHDDYAIASCYIEGTLQYKQNESCQWQIYAGGVGVIQCNQNMQYYVCDNDKCRYLFP